MSGRRESLTRDRVRVPTLKRASSFTPPAVSGANLKLFLDPTDTRPGINTYNGSRISTLTDKSGSGLHFVQATGARQPAQQLVQGRQFARYTLVSGEYLKGPTMSATFPTAVHSFVVMFILADPPIGQTYVPWKWDANTVGNNLIIFTDSNLYDGFGSTTRKSTGNPAVSFATPVVYEIISVAGEHTFRVNDALHFTTAVNAVGWDPTQSILGSGSTTLGTDPPTNNWDGGFGIHLCYDAKLSGADATAVINALKAWHSIP
jgi:hypothetical protein